MAGRPAKLDNNGKDIEYITMKSQYSMGSLDFLRYDGILKIVDERGYAVGASKRPQEHIQPYASILEQLYTNLQCLMTDALREKYKAEFTEIKKKIRYGNLDYTLVDRLRDINERLIRIKQSGGLGMTIHREYTEKEQAKTIYGIKE